MSAQEDTQPENGGPAQLLGTAGPSKVSWLVAPEQAGAYLLEGTMWGSW